MPLKTLIVTDSHTGKRLDLFIQHHEAHISRNRIQALLAEGLALVNGKTEKPSYKVKPGDRVTLELPERPVREVLPENIPLNVIYEDDFMVVLNKPPGLVVHPAPGNYTITGACRQRGRGPWKAREASASGQALYIASIRTRRALWSWRGRSKHSRR